MANENRSRPVPVAIAARAQGQTVYWIIALFLAVIATYLLSRPQNPFALPQAFGAPNGMAGANGIYAFTGQLDRDRYGLFMMDIDAGNIWCYEYLPGTQKLRLAAARSFIYDRVLKDYQNDKDTRPDAIRRLVEGERNKTNRQQGFGGNGDAEDAVNPVFGNSILSVPVDEDAASDGKKDKP